MEGLVVFITLCFLEVILGVDNIFAFSMLVLKAPRSERLKTKIIALGGAFILRILLLIGALSLKKSEFYLTLFGHQWLLSHLFFVLGGVFLIYKGITEFLGLLHSSAEKPNMSTQSIIAQIIFIDFVFSIDSVLAAIALTSSASIIVLSIGCSLVFMFYLAELIINNIDKSWRFKALGSLIVGLIGLYLVAQGASWGWDDHSLIFIIASLCCYELLMTYVKFKRRRTMSLTHN